MHEFRAAELELDIQSHALRGQQIEARKYMLQQEKNILTEASQMLRGKKPRASTSRVIESPDSPPDLVMIANSEFSAVTSATSEFEEPEIEEMK